MNMRSLLPQRTPLKYSPERRSSRQADGIDLVLRHQLLRSFDASLTLSRRNRLRLVLARLELR